MAHKPILISITWSTLKLYLQQKYEFSDDSALLYHPDEAMDYFVTIKQTY